MLVRQSTRRAYWTAADVCMVLVVSGCWNSIRWPNLYHPGTAGVQRANAVVHDPYPLNDVGPEVVGGRPREYQISVPEVERARMFSGPPRSPSPVTNPFASVVQPPCATFPATPTPTVLPPTVTMPAGPAPVPLMAPAPTVPCQMTPTPSYTPPPTVTPVPPAQPSEFPRPFRY